MASLSLGSAEGTAPAVGTIPWANSGGLCEPCPTVSAGHGGCSAPFVLVCCQRHLWGVWNRRHCGGVVSCTNTEVCNSDGASPTRETQSFRCPKRFFPFINLLFPHACESHLPQEPGSRELLEPGAQARPSRGRASSQPANQGARGHKLALPTTPSSPFLSSVNFGELIPSN